MSPVVNAILERALRTFAQTFLAAIGGDQANLFTISLAAALQLSVSAAALSVLTSFTALRTGKNGPSFTTEHIDPTTVGGH